jgi:2-oxoglutarate dehydrogenase E2 component (dihydrolipoamide succinyltransferase)
MIGVGLAGAFCKAVAHAAKAQPAVNAFIDGKDVVYHDYVNISVAVASPKGLVVPVVRNVETKSIAEVEASIMVSRLPRYFAV